MHAHVGLGFGEAGSADEAEQPPLGLGPGDGRGAVVEEAADARGTAPLELVAVGEALHERLGEEALERGGAQVRREVEDRAGGTGERQAVADRHVVTREFDRAVDRDPGAFEPAAVTDGDVHLVDPRRDPPQRGGAPVAEDRVRSTGEQRRRLVTEGQMREVPDGIDTAVHAVQPTGLDPCVDRRSGEPERVKLRHRDPSVLALRDRRNTPIARTVADEGELRAVKAHHAPRTGGRSTMGAFCTRPGHAEHPPSPEPFGPGGGAES